jgi:L-threonylcarbamoyladenylate synthase
MQTQLLPVTPSALALAGELIRSGALVAFPTETVYGLGANALNAEAVKRIFEAKGRPGDNPLIVHISAIDQLATLISGAPSPAARRLMDACWPGPMTLIFPKSEIIPPAVTAGLDTVAVRYPVHPAAQALIDAAGWKGRVELRTRRDADRAVLEVASTNTRAIRLYERMGFVTVGERSKWYHIT